MARLRLPFAFFLSVLLIPGLLRADVSCEQGSPAGYINLRIGEYYPDCPLDFVPGLVFVYVEVRSLPASGVHFSIPDPPYGTVVGAQWNFPATGTVQTGVDISLAPCTAPISQTVTLGYLLITVPSGLTPDCVIWKANDGAEIVDCEGVVRPALSQTFAVGVGGAGCNCCLECWGEGVPAYDLVPADGATAFPLDGSLTWQGTSGFDEFQHCSVQMGTNPDCTTWTTYPVDCSAELFAPGFLQHGTTYYWRVVYSGSWESATSPGQSFTTQGPVSVSPATWGRVKAMYRE